MDLYAQAEALGADLWENDYRSWRDRIDDAIGAGATGSEILMCLRWVLTELLDSEPDLEDQLRRRANKLRADVADALG